MKSKFNYKLFLDGIRQLRTIGIVSLLIFCTEAVFSVIGINLSLQNQASYINMTSSQVAVVAETFNLYKLHPILFASFLIVIPIMILYLFGFMNKRNASDFYNSAPVKREALALSFLAAIMSWVLIIVFASTALVCIMTVFAQFVSINMYSVLVSLAATVAAALCVLGAGFFAMSVTGTYFSNFAVSVMLLTAPRLIITTFVAILSAVNPLLPFSFDSGLLDYRLNIVVGSILSSLIDNDALYPLEHFVPVIYTLVLSVFYFAAGFYAFINRKSEIATMPAANKWLQLLFRLVPSMLICLIPIAIISYDVYYYGYYPHHDSSMTVFFIVLLYVVAVIVYFLYELISTKKISSLLKSAKTLWVLAAFNVIFFIALIIGYHVTLNDVPDKSDVSSVMIKQYHLSSNNYFTETSASVKITNRELLDLCVDVLKHNVECVKNKEHVGNTITVTFNAKGRTIKRYIGFDTRQEYDQFIKLLNNCDEYANIYKVLPEYDRLPNMILHVTDFSGDRILSSDDIRELYNSLRNEQMSLDYESAAYNASSTSLYTNFATFHESYAVDRANYHYIVGITGASPKTALLLIDKINNSDSGFRLEDLAGQKHIRLSLYENGSFDVNDLNTLDDAFETTTLASEISDPPAGNVTSLTVSQKELRSLLIDELVKTADVKITTLDKPVVRVAYDTYEKRCIRYFMATDEFIRLYKGYFK